MRWYSVKKYKIPTNYKFIFVALEDEETCIFLMAKYTYCDENDEFKWIDEDDRILSKVTHFCIPEPVEIDG